MRGARGSGPAALGPRRVGCPAGLGGGFSVSGNGAEASSAGCLLVFPSPLSLAPPGERCPAEEKRLDCCE